MSDATRTPEHIIGDALAVESNQPLIRSVCLTSGGGDSTVLAHRCRDHYDELVHIDTGTALPGVRSFVESFAVSMNKPLRVVEAHDAYRRMVLGADEWWPIYRANRLLGEGPDDYHVRVKKLPTREQRMGHGVHIAPMGFPGPGGHAFAYQKLKERQLEKALRDIKAEFAAPKKQAQRVMLLSGVRLDESARRKMTGAARGEWERKGNQLWVSPLTYFTNLEMARYRKEHSLPVSDVTAIMHRSGECNCLAFAAPGEREDIIQWYPDWFAENIAPLEQEAQARGLKYATWGWGAGRREKVDASGPMCSSCDLAYANQEQAA